MGLNFQLSQSENVLDTQRVGDLPLGPYVARSGTSRDMAPSIGTPSGDIGDWKYRIYRSKGNEDFEQIGETDDSSFSSKDVVPGRTYEYYITVVNGFSVESGPSAIVSFTPRQP